MKLTAKTTLAAMKMPLTVEKDGRRYSLDIADDEQGVDLVLEREQASGLASQVSRPKTRATAASGARSS